LTFAYISKTEGKDYYDWNNVDHLKPDDATEPRLLVDFRVSNYALNGTINGYDETHVSNVEYPLFCLTGESQIAKYKEGNFKISTTIKAQKALSK
jgi:hypothetical protein